MKLIKNTSIGSYLWSGSNSNTSNTWRYSTLNTGTLNGTYLNGLGTTWSDMIETHTWKVGGVAADIMYNSALKTVYNYELGSTTYNAKIGLMYVSDYGYAASPNYWATFESSKGSNWLNVNIIEWTISRRLDYPGYAFVVASTGFVGDLDVYNNNYGVRPSFYLKSNVAITSGDGSRNSPFRVTLG